MEGEDGHYLRGLQMCLEGLGQAADAGCPSTCNTVKESRDAALILAKHKHMKANNE